RCDNRRRPEHPLPRQVVSLKTVQGRRNIHGAFDAHRVESQGQRQIAERNVAKCKAEGERIKRPCRQPRDREQQEQQALAVDEWKRQRDQRECGGTRKENRTRSKQGAEVDGQRSNEHEGDVESTSDPGALVEAESDSSFEIRQTKRE